MNVLRLQKFIIRENFLFRRSCGQKLEDILDAQPVTSNTRTSSAFASLDGYTIKEVFARRANIAFLRANREPEADGLDVAVGLGVGAGDGVGVGVGVGTLGVGVSAKQVGASANFLGSSPKKVGASANFLGPPMKKGGF
jgi:hypothetical protein